MSTYYCYKCTKTHNIVAPVDPSQLTANAYQLNKFVKHTAPLVTYPVNSVFKSKDWNAYKDYMTVTTMSGCVEIDDAGRKNLIYFAGEETGLRYDDGKFKSTCSGVILVCSESSGKIHAFPSDFQPESKMCAKCGSPVPFHQ